MSNAGRFAGKSIVVTGAAQGIGRQVAIAAAAEGARMTLVDRSPLVEDVAAEIKAQGGQAIAVLADLETFAGNAKAMKQAAATYGAIDILVNNVGGAIWMKPFEEFEEDQIEAEIRRSLFPTLWGCRAVLPYMLAQGHGAIVNVSSIATRGINRVPYSAAKGGVNALTAVARIRSCGQEHPRQCGRSWRHRCAAAKDPARQPQADQAGQKVDPAGRRPDGAVEPDEALRHARRAGGSHPVPRLRCRLIHYRHHPARRWWRPRLNLAIET